MDTKIYKQIAEAGVITERQILTMKNRCNKGFWFEVNDIFRRGTLKITPEQTKKGLDWLLDHWKTPKGATRKHNPFKTREQVILSHFDHFELVDFMDFGNFIANYYLPVYRVYSKKGHFFDYVAKYGDKTNPIEIVTLAF